MIYAFLSIVLCYEQESIRNHCPRNLSRVAAERDVDATALPPLQATVDVDALNALFDGRFSGACSFTYAGCEIIISGTDSIRVRRHREDATEGSVGTPPQPSID